MGHGSLEIFITLFLCSFNANISNSGQLEVWYQWTRRGGQEMEADTGRHCLSSSRAFFLRCYFKFLTPFLSNKIYRMNPLQLTRKTDAFFLMTLQPLWALAAFQSPDLFTIGTSPWMSDQLVARPLPKHRINTYTHQTSMPWVGFEPTITASEQAKTVHALDCSASVTGKQMHYTCGNTLIISACVHSPRTLINPSAST
jgi:hypothetical protein